MRAVAAFIGFSRVSDRVCFHNRRDWSLKLEMARYFWAAAASASSASESRAVTLCRVWPSLGFLATSLRSTQRHGVPFPRVASDSYRLPEVAESAGMEDGLVGGCGRAFSPVARRSFSCPGWSNDDRQRWPNAGAALGRARNILSILGRRDERDGIWSVEAAGRTLTRRSATWAGRMHSAAVDRATDLATSLPVPSPRHFPNRRVGYPPSFRRVAQLGTEPAAAAVD